MAMKIEAIVSDVYGIGALHLAAALPVLWAADRIEDTEEAKKELRRVNRKREKMGLPAAYPEYGSRLF